MPKKVYIASKCKHADRWKELRKVLAGHLDINSTWIDEAEESATKDWPALACRCLTEVAAAHHVVLYCEPGEILKGALLEAGAALALGKEVRCVGDCESIGRMAKAHPLWKQYRTIAAALLADSPDVIQEQI